MFTLRQISKKGEQPVHNQILGDHYSIIYKELHKEDFDHLAEKDVITQRHYDNCYALVIYGHGSQTWPLYKGFYYYIMTGEGKTFDNITFR